MGLDDKIDDRAQVATGEVGQVGGQVAGQAAGGEEPQAEGKAERVATPMSQAGQKIKEIFKR
jgi:hypothetical protein